MLFPIVLKELNKELAAPFTLLFNLSLDKRYLPDDWRTAEVVAIFKKGDIIIKAISMVHWKSPPSDEEM